MESTNPKDKIGKTKPPLHLIPPSAEIAESMAFEVGAAKYGPYNWREATVAASVYMAAAKRHLAQWWDGNNIDPESGATHLAHARACLAILIDAESIGKLVDDRPLPGASAEMIAHYTRELNAGTSATPEPIDLDAPGTIDGVMPLPQWTFFAGDWNLASDPKSAGFWRIDENGVTHFPVNFPDDVEIANYMPFALALQYIAAGRWVKNEYIPELTPNHTPYVGSWNNAGAANEPGCWIIDENGNVYFITEEGKTVLSKHSLRMLIKKIKAYEIVPNEWPIPAREPAGTIILPPVGSSFLIPPNLA